MHSSAHSDAVIINLNRLICVQLHSSDLPAMQKFLVDAIIFLQLIINSLSLN